ncbi:hypothetical protein AB3N59_16235 [Leptospira sp. WS92.C1]
MRKISLLLLLFLPGLYYVGTVLSWDQKKRIPITGDEPHYLMIAESILADGDLDLKNNYQEDAISKKIIGPVDVENHTVSKDGKWYSVHSVAVSWIALPGYAISGIKGARTALAIFAGLLPFLFYGIGRRFDLSKEESVALSILYAIGLPFPMAAGQIFPDLPSGIGLTFVFMILLSLESDVLERKFQNILFFACGLGIGFLVWFHIKNLPVLFLLFLWFVFKKKWDWKSKGIVIALVAASILVLFFCNFLWYDSVLGAFFTTRIHLPKLDSNFKHWITVGPGLLMDRNQGLFFQNPMIWIPGSLGWILLFQKENFRKIGILLFLISLTQLGLSAGHSCSYGCLSLPGRFQWGTAAIWFIPFLSGWILIKNVSKIASWGICFVYVSYQIWIGKFWFDHTASLYHVMNPDPQKRPGFFPDTVLVYLPSWTNTESSWKTAINWVWIFLFVFPVVVLGFYFIRNKFGWGNGLNPLVDRETK